MAGTYLGDRVASVTGDFPAPASDGTPYSAAYSAQLCGPDGSPLVWSVAPVLRVESARGVWTSHTGTLSGDGSSAGWLVAAAVVDGWVPDPLGRVAVEIVEAGTLRARGVLHRRSRGSDSACTFGSIATTIVISGGGGGGGGPHAATHAAGGTDPVSPASIGAAEVAHTHTAGQVSGLATVATSGAFGDLSGKPTLGTAAAAAVTDFATASQGAKADSASQPGHGHVVADTAGLQAALDGKQPAGAYSLVGHGHTLDQTTDTATRLALTPAERTKLANTSGTNTGDQTLPTWTTLSGKPAVIAAGADAAAARTAIGAGTSNLAIGTTAGTAKAGDYAPDLSGLLTTAAAPELIRDTMGTALVAGANVTITPNDPGDTITIAASGGGGGVDLGPLNRPTYWYSLGAAYGDAGGFWEPNGCFVAMTVGPTPWTISAAQIGFYSAQAGASVEMALWTFDGSTMTRVGSVVTFSAASTGNVVATFASPPTVSGTVWLGYRTNFTSMTPFLHQNVTVPPPLYPRPLLSNSESPGQTPATMLAGGWSDSSATVVTPTIARAMSVPATQLRSA